MARYKFDLDFIYAKITSPGQDYRMPTAAYKQFMLESYDQFLYNGCFWQATGKSLGAGVWSVTAKRRD